MAGDLSGGMGEAKREALIVFLAVTRAASQFLDMISCLGEKNSPSRPTGVDENADSVGFCSAVDTICMPTSRER